MSSTGELRIAMTVADDSERASARSGEGGQLCVCVCGTETERTLTGLIGVGPVTKRHLGKRTRVYMYAISKQRSKQRSK